MKRRLIKIQSCTDVAKHICENLDDQIHSEYCREIRRHLAECPNCTAYLDSLKKTVRLYKTEPFPRIPTGVRKHLFAVLKLKT